MKYLILILIAIGITGCGGSSQKNDQNPPASPHAQQSSKIPPSVPNID